MSESLKEYCICYDRRELLAQWHPDKNGDLTPDKITSESQRKVWWRCDQGHEWMSLPYDRTKRGIGCPYCAGKRILPGMDLASLYPHLAAQWHPQRNGELRTDEVLPGSHRAARWHPDKNEPLEPSMVLPGSTKRVWWRCSDGHEWKAVIHSRTGAQKSGCPVCAGKTPRMYK